MAGFHTGFFFLGGGGGGGGEWNPGFLRGKTIELNFKLFEFLLFISYCLNFNWNTLL